MAAEIDTYDNDDIIDFYNDLAFALYKLGKKHTNPAVIAHLNSSICQTVRVSNHYKRLQLVRRIKLGWWKK